MDVQFVASIAPIVRDAVAARAFYQGALGLSFEGGEGTTPKHAVAASASDQRPKCLVPSRRWVNTCTLRGRGRSDTGPSSWTRTSAGLTTTSARERLEPRREAGRSPCLRVNSDGVGAAAICRAASVPATRTSIKLPGDGKLPGVFARR